MNNSDNIMLRPHKIALEDDKVTIHMDSGDHMLLKVYKNSLKAPLQPLYTSYWAPERAVMRKNMTNRSEIFKKECGFKQKSSLSTSKSMANCELSTQPWGETFKMRDCNGFTLEFWSEI